MADDTLINYYRARAGEYEQIYYRDNPVRRGEIEDEKKRLTNLVSGKRVLELACGTGYWTEVMSKTASEIIAVDFSPEMLREAAKKSFGCRVDLREADLAEPIDNVPPVDVVALGFWFSHQPKEGYERFFETVSAPLSPGGRIWMIDNNPPAEGPERRSVRVDEQGNNYKRRWLENGLEHIILKNYFSEEELRRLFSAYFTVEKLIFEEYYWSVLLSPRK